MLLELSSIGTLAMQSNRVSYHGGPKVPTPTLFILTYWGIMCPSTAELYIDAIAVINCTKEHLYQLWVYCIGVSLPDLTILLIQVSQLYALIYLC